MFLQLTSSIRKSFSFKRPIFSPAVTYNFFFSKSQPATDPYNFDPKIKEDILHERRFAQALKNIDSFPVDIGRDIHPEQRTDLLNVFNKSTYLRVMASEEFKEWESMYNLYCKALEEKNPSLLKGKAEMNVIKRMDKFFRDISGLGLQLEILRTDEPKNILSIAVHKTIEGVFIDRILNLHSSDYFMKISKEKQSYEPAKGKKWAENATTKLPKIDPKELVDADLEVNYLEKDRSKMSINQYFIEVETNSRIVLTRKDAGQRKVIYGAEEPGWETHYMIIENRRDLSH